ncbi:MAG: hypothetical protein N4A57_00860 [Anaeromicrobium sp.]|jgi:hypothetical protein|uniref:hypothetical protein n=1 Tax=Anaeromicrobium sp. TaxID=1929132 RepID=UPI0025F8A874|nr:hypothetical protein [Anaeromicrobium sp.]MCT4592814.1 hypothetical protein [Anaeromicrobium sp.]
MDKEYKVLLVDDRTDFSEGFKNEAQHHNILVATRTNYKDMVECLPKIKDKLATIILDIKCLKTPDQEIESEDFLTLALGHLDQNYSHIPRVILTADSARYDFVSKWFSNEKVYRKTTQDISALFECIKNNGEKIDSIKIRHKYRDVFKLFDKQYLSEDTENDLLDLLMNMENKELSQIKKNLSAVRRIQEDVLQTINKINRNIIPDDCLKPNKDIKFHTIHRHLMGNKTRENNYKPTTTTYYDGVIEVFSESIYRVASDNGSHNPYLNPKYTPTKYTVQAVVYGLLDFLLWFERTIN